MSKKIEKSDEDKIKVIKFPKPEDLEFSEEQKQAFRELFEWENRWKKFPNKIILK